MIRTYGPEDLPPKGHFHYHQGVFLSGMYQVYKLCGDERYFNYIKAWVDSVLDPYGNITTFNPGQLDDLQPGILLFPLLERTGDDRYRTAIDTVAYYIKHFARNPEGGFWHKAWHRNQMWLDGLYMGGPFAAQYGREFGRPEFYDIDVFQAVLMEERLKDAKTGLWVHAWDYDKRQLWAHPQTGLSSEFWGRSIGWVPVALLDELEFIPQDHLGRPVLERMTCELLKSLAPYQDGETGLWYQVIDKANAPENWLETSCTCLFAAAISRAVRKGLLGKDYLAVAHKAYDGVIKRLGYNENGIIIDNVCIGTAVGDFAHYCARPTSANDLHGVGAFLLMCAEIAQAWEDIF